MVKIQLQTSDFLFYYDQWMLNYKPVFTFYTEESITIEFEKSAIWPKKLWNHRHLKLRKSRKLQRSYLHKSVKCYAFSFNTN